MHHKKHLQSQRRNKRDGHGALRSMTTWLLSTKRTGKNRGHWLPLKRRLNSKIEAGACWVLHQRVFAALGGGEGAMYIGPYRKGLDAGDGRWLSFDNPRFVIITILEVRSGGTFIASHGSLPEVNSAKPEYCLCLTSDSVCVEIASYDLLRCGYRLSLGGKVA